MEQASNRVDGPDGKEPTVTRRRVRWAGALVAGALAASIGVGFAVQASANAGQTSQTPAGSQLPWDDSSERNDGGPSRDGERRDKMREHMSSRQSEPGRRGVEPTRHRPVGGLRELFAGAAETIGITPEQLRDELRSGKSIAEIATEKGVSVQDVIDALVEEVMANATERITALVNRKPGTPGSDTPES